MACKIKFAHMPYKEVYGLTSGSALFSSIFLRLAGLSGSKDIYTIRVTLYYQIPNQININWICLRLYLHKTGLTNFGLAKIKQTTNFLCYDTRKADKISMMRDY